MIKIYCDASAGVNSSHYGWAVVAVDEGKIIGLRTGSRVIRKGEHPETWVVERALKLWGDHDVEILCDCDHPLITVTHVDHGDLYFMLAHYASRDVKQRKDLKRLKRAMREANDRTETPKDE